MEKGHIFPCTLGKESFYPQLYFVNILVLKHVQHMCISYHFKLHKHTVNYETACFKHIACPHMKV